MKNCYPIDIIPSNDQQRVEALNRYGIFNAAKENAFDHIATLARTIFKVPIAHLSFLDATHEFVMASEGLPTMGLIPRGESLCALTILKPEVVVIENALEEPLLNNHPYVHGDFGLRFYAGAPIITPDNYIIGTMCIVDQQPRKLTPHEVEILAELAKVAMDQVELRCTNIENTQMQLKLNEQLKTHIAQKDEFISIASHELRTPITTLKASLQLLTKMKLTQGNPPAEKMMAQANKSVSNLNNLIGDLLSVTRIGNSLLQLEQSSQRIGEMISNTASILGLAQGQELIITGDPTLQVNVDQYQIERVLTNLIDNALKYAPESKTIAVHVAKEKDFAKVSIKDKGPGIKDEQLKNLFDRYNQSYDSAFQTSGLGLGLYLSAQLIKMHGGAIGVETSAEGSKFWFTLPISTNNN